MGCIQSKGSAGVVDSHSRYATDNQEEGGQAPAVEKPTTQAKGGGGGDYTNIGDFKPSADKPLQEEEVEDLQAGGAASSVPKAEGELVSHPNQSSQTLY
jgi:hypothetical protein